MSKEAVAACWARIRGRLRNEFGDAAYRNWLKAMTLVEVRDNVVRIAAPCKLLDDGNGDGARHALRRRAGTVFRVLAGGPITVGDEVGGA